MPDRFTETLLDALKLALADGGEHRLYRSGKLDGLFPGRTGTHGEAAAFALREGLLEPVRTETTGRTVIEWVRLTPRGVDYLHERESPLRALEELREALRTAEAGVPAWVAEMRRQLQAMSDRLEEDWRRLLNQLGALGRRVDEALNRLEQDRPRVPENVAAEVPWALDAVEYLERRRSGRAPGDCALPELFAALAEKHPALSVAAFHEGLRRLHGLRVLRL